MKRILFLFSFLLISLFLKAQDYQITFGVSGSDLIPDSVNIQNLDQSTELDLLGSDILHLVGEVTGLNESVQSTSGLKVYPNPFPGKTNVELFCPQGGTVHLILSDMTGKLIEQQTYQIQSGLLSFAVSGLGKGMYILKVSGQEIDYSAKLLSLYSNDMFTNNHISFEGIGQIHSERDAVNDTDKLKGAQETGETKQMQYNYGELLHFTGFIGSYVSETELTPSTSQVLELDFSPIADFSSSLTNVTEGDIIQFTDLSTNYPDTWLWNFGDGGSSMLQNPTYTFNTAGTYSVSLDASNTYGLDTETKTSYITVNLPGIIFNPNLTYGTMTDIDGNEYRTIQIGNQVWMAENLRTTRYADGTAIPYVGSFSAWTNLSETDQAFCWYDNNISNREIYGGLYTWYAAMNGETSNDSNPSEVQGVCPSGWHLPSDEEWKELEMHLGMSQADADIRGLRGTDEGGQLKETGTSHWNSPNTGVTNASGFTSLPGGYRGGSGDGYMGIYAVFWSTTEHNATYAWFRNLVYDQVGVGRDYDQKMAGFSVRCVQDPVVIAPIAEFSASATEIGAGESITFTDQSTNVPTSWFWDFGDAATSTSQSPSHTYVTAGTYTVSLTASNSAGEDSEIKSSYITVNELVVAPVAEFTASATNIAEGESITFTDQSTNVPTSWYWDFGDGGTSTAQNPSHTYSIAGTYTVSLTASNSAGSDSEIKTNHIIVEISHTFGTISDIDGNEYRTIQIGNQVWMAENLKVTHYSDGTAIPLIESASEWVGLEEEDRAYCWYDNSTANADLYGALYTWGAAMNGASSSDANPSIVQGVCPHGWHLPSDEEWKELEMHLGMNQAEADDIGSRGIDEGGMLKATGTMYWNNPNEGATNVSGFSALPGGLRYHDGSFMNIGYHANLWTATEQAAISAWYRYLSYDNTLVGRHGQYKKNGFSVRCVQGQPITAPVAKFKVSLKEVIAGKNIRFVDQSNNEPTSWSWDFGDGNTSNEKNPTHNYDTPGSYTVSLTVTNTAGTDSEIKSDYINIKSFGTMTDIDGSIYETIQIGSQVWMADNLKVTRFADGTAIPIVDDYLDWSELSETDIAYSWWDTNISNKDAGGLYTWAAAMNGASSSGSNPSAVQGICPDGWHLPSDTEWNELEYYLIANGYNYDGSYTGDKTAKSLASTNGWQPSSESGAVGNDPESNNTTGFAALPLGFRTDRGTYSLLSFGTSFWSATESSNSDAWHQFLVYDGSIAYEGSATKNHGNYVRCIQDHHNTTPLADFIGQITNMAEGNNVNFIDQSKYYPTSWLWDFGDGTTSTEQNPSHVYSTAGIYTVSLTVTNSAGTHSEVKSDYITVEPYGTMTDIDGNTYKTIKIGSQVWMAENLKVTHYADGSAIPFVESESEWDAFTSIDEAYAWYENSTTNRDLYGGLYTWAAALNGSSSSDANPSGIQGVCPAGWHLPSNDEWKELEMYLGMSQEDADDTGSRGTDEGGKLKTTGLEYWNSPNEGATNESGFSAFPGGFRFNDGSYNGLGNSAWYWSATESGSYYAWIRILGATASDITSVDNLLKRNGSSVRCIRDF